MSKVRSVLLITLFSFGSIIVSFFSQIIIAKYFGTSRELDAFLAAYAIPQYVISVIMSSLGFILVPLLVEYKVNKYSQIIFNITGNLINSLLPIFLLFTIIGEFFAKQILHITAPGLDEHSLVLSSEILRIILPTVLLSFISSALKSVYQVQNKFGWQSFSPFMGVAIGLFILIIWGDVIGVKILAITTLISSIVETILLLRVIKTERRYFFTINWRDPILRKIFHILFPLILIGALTKFTPLLDRYLASDQKAGGISILNYSFQFVSVLSILISTGITTVIFPQLAFHKAEKNAALFRETYIDSLKKIWLVIIPFITIGYILALPFTIIFFQRGMFTYYDSVTVAKIIQIYLFGLIGMGLGAITGKIFYILQDTKTLAKFGILESIFYIIYTLILSKYLGLHGIALGYIIYFLISITWHFIYVWIKLKIRLEKFDIYFSLQVLFAGLCGAFLSYLITLLTSSFYFQIIIGGSLGLLVYIAVLRFILPDYIKSVLFTLFSK